MIEAGVAGGELERQMRLAAERPPPGRAQQRHQVGPQGGRTLGVDVGWGEHLHQASAVGQPASLAAPDYRDGHGHDNTCGDNGRAGGDAEMGGQRAEVVEQPGRFGSGVGEVAGEWPRRVWRWRQDRGRLREWARSRGQASFRRWLTGRGCRRGSARSRSGTRRLLRGWRWR